MGKTDPRHPNDGPYDLVVAGGLVVTGDGPAAPGDVAVRGETIARVAARIGAPCGRRIDARGLVVMPGLIDPHVHLSLPTRGTISSDDPSSGTRAALYGGVTTILDFTLQQPGERLVESVERRQREFAGRAHADYAFHTNVTWFPGDFADRLPTELDELVQHGATTLKIFTCYSREGYSIGPGDLRTLLHAAGSRGMLVLVHAEDDALVAASTARLEAARRTSPADYALSRPADAEARAVAAVAAAARDAGAHVYFVHVSSAAGLEAALTGRRQALGAVHIETCPQYLALDDARFAGPDGAQYMLAPPLRTPRDREALLHALAAGQIDVVATDHCPFRRAQKDLPGAPFTRIPNGLPGVETRLPILHTLCVGPGQVTWEHLVALTATQPAQIHGLAPRKGAIRPGADADLVLFDPAATWRLEASALHMNTDFSPYENMVVRGRVRSVILRGHVVIDEGELRGEPSGQFLERRPRQQTGTGDRRP
jgi:dihydropyrimidinase